MVASTDIKFYVHTNNNAPQLQNVFGSMINVLDACLIDGIQIGAVNSLTAVGSVVTATFGAAHNLMQYQVIKITGAAQSEFNGEYRILTIPDSSSLTFELATAPSVTTATGAISASLPPLGWEKPFSSSNPNGGGKAAYRSLNLLLPSRPFLRVVDELDPAYTATYAKYAKVGIVEDMTDIDTMLGVQAPFDAVNPNKNWVGTGSETSAINGWAKWYYARAGNGQSNNTDLQAVSNGNRHWLLVGTNDYFYIFAPNSASQSTVAEKAANPYGFGTFDRMYHNDVSNVFLNATINYVSASTSYQCGDKSSGISRSDRDLLILFKPIEQTSEFATARIQTISDGVIMSGSNNGYLNTAFTPLLPAIILENNNPFSETRKTLRGSLSGYYWLNANIPLNDFQIFTQNKSLYIAKIVSTGSSGQVVVKVGEL